MFNKINKKYYDLVILIKANLQKIAKIDRNSRQKPRYTAYRKGGVGKRFQLWKGKSSMMLVFSNEIKNFWREWVVEIEMI